MKNLLLLLSLFISSAVYSQAPAPQNTAKINWMTWDEAVAQSKKDEALEKEKKGKRKKIFIDFHTAWCGWCKRMDATTFANPSIVEYMNKNYYPVKFDAEGMDTIVFKGTVFMNSEPTFKKTGARGKVHILAYSLLEGKLSYPSYTILDETFNRVHIISGYKTPEPMLGTLLFFAGEEYKHYHNYVHGQWQRAIQMQKQQQEAAAKKGG